MACSPASAVGLRLQLSYFDAAASYSSADFCSSPYVLLIIHGPVPVAGGKTAEYW